MNYLLKKEKGEEGKILKAKIGILLSLALCTIIVLPVTIVPVKATNGPYVSKLFIKNYGAMEPESEALQSGEIDLTDWPLSKTYIDKWTLGPDGIPGTGDELVYNGVDPSTDQIRLDDYSEIGSFEYDIYNQKWPTGVGDRYLEDTLTYDAETGTYKHYYDPTNQWDQRAWQFRIALRYMTDMDYVKTEVLKGYGMMFENSFMPQPLTGWLDIANLTNSQFTAPYGGIVIPSLVYPSTKNVAMAQALLDAAGFTMITSGPDAGKRQDPRKPAGQALDPLIFYIRSDHTERKLAGEKLAGDLMAIGIPVDSRVVAKTVAWRAVMVDYNYNLYTGGYSMGVDPSWLYGTFDSSQYWGAPSGSHYDGTQYDIGWSGGYQGICIHRLDDYTTDSILYGTTKQDVTWGVHNATYLLNKYAAVIGLWSSAGVQAYRTGWEGVVNQFGYGPSAPLTGGAYLYSLVNMKDNRPQPITTHPVGYQTNTLVWGFKSNVEALHVITSEWVWDWNALTCMYDLLITSNPYNPAEDWPWLATNWDVSTWNHPTEGPSTMINLTIRQNAYWHYGGQVTPADIAFSIRFTRDAGPGVAWNFAGAKDVDHVTTWDYTGSGGKWGVVVYFKINSYYALHYVGWLPMFSKAVWMAASAGKGFGYTEGDPGTFVDRMAVREYHPWTDNYYTPGTSTPDLTDDGSGPWKYVGADSLLMEWYEFQAWGNWFYTQTELRNMLGNAFWSIGDVNGDTEVSTPDMSLIAHALLATPASGGVPGEWWAWNNDADINKDNIVNGDDIAIAGKSFGMNAG
jgi:hypothetical protein